MIRKGILIGLRLLVSGGLLGWIVAEADLSETLEHVGTLSLGAVALVLAVLLAQSLVAALRWRYVTSIVGADLPAIHAWSGFLVGLFFSQGLPTSIGGDAVRAWRLTRLNIPFGTAVVSVLLDRIAGLSTLLLLIGTTLPLFFWMTEDSAPGFGMAFVVVVGLSGIALAVKLRRIPRVLERFRLIQVVGTFRHHLRRIGSGLHNVSRVAGISLVIHLLTVSVAYVIAVDIEASISFVECLVVVPSAILVSALPISIGGWGLREGAIVAGFGFIGVPMVTALFLSIMLGLGMLVIGLIGGIVWLAEGAGRLRRIPRSAP